MQQASNGADLDVFAVELCCGLFGVVAEVAVAAEEEEELLAAQRVLRADAKQEGQRVHAAGQLGSAHAGGLQTTHADDTPSKRMSTQRRRASVADLRLLAALLRASLTST